MRETKGTVVKYSINLNACVKSTRQSVLLINEGFVTVRKSDGVLWLEREVFCQVLGYLRWSQSACLGLMCNTRGVSLFVSTEGDGDVLSILTYSRWLERIEVHIDSSRNQSCT